MPVMKAARLGAQTPEIEKARVYRIPSIASRSMFGDVATASP